MALRRLLGKLLGFTAEIASLRSQLEELRWDGPFGMYTRGAFLQLCRVMPRGPRNLAFIDLDDINALNDRLGYTVVDERVRATFSVPFRRSDVVARWYSGDEIVILFDSDMTGAERKLDELRESAKRNGLSFEATFGVWQVGKEPVEDVVTRLAEQIATLKRGRSRRKPPQSRLRWAR